MNIVDLFKKQQGLKVPVKRTGRSSLLRLRKLNRALEDLNYLIKSSKAQVRLYGHIIVSEGNFDRRHQMVRAFLHRQKNNDKTQITLSIFGVIPSAMPEKPAVIQLRDYGVMFPPH